jgi:hypothetical protein
VHDRVGSEAVERGKQCIAVHDVGDEGDGAEILHEAAVRGIPDHGDGLMAVVAQCLEQRAADGSGRSCEYDLHRCSSGSAWPPLPGKGAGMAHVEPNSGPEPDKVEG